MKTLVTGGTGTVGSRVVEGLRQRGIAVRVLARKRPARLPEGVDLVVGDLLDPISTQRALEGVDKVYLLNAVAPDELTQALIAYTLARRGKVCHIVYHSVFRVDRFPEVPHFAAKIAVEGVLQTSDVPFTILRPSYFYQNDALLAEAVLGAGVFPMPFGSVGTSAVDVRDIAEAAVGILTSDGHAGKTYNVVGPDNLTGPQVAALWAELLHRDVRYGGEDLDTWETESRKRAPAWFAFDFRVMFQAYLERGFLAVPEDVANTRRLLGHSPRTYEAFARETAGDWLMQKAELGTRAVA